MSPADVTWYATLADAQNQINPVSSTTVLENGAVFYTVNTSESGCVSDVFSVTTWVTLGTGSFDAFSLSVYPNPTSGDINFTASKEIKTVKLYNIIGQEVVSRTMNALEGNIDASGLPAGTYVMKLFSGDATQTVKVIKK